jgi:putative adhesin
MRRVSLIFATLALTTAASAHADSNANIHRTFNVGNGGTIHLDADVGDVRVESGGAGTLTVEVTRRGSSDEMKENVVTFDQSGNDVNVRSRFEHESSWFHWSRDLSVHYTIHIPARYNVDLKTSGGDISGDDIGGNADVRTSGGNVKLARVSGVVHAHTSGGDVEIREVGGNLEAKTSGGSIEVSRAGGTVLARTSGGGIRIDDAADTVDASTSGGSITARFSRQPRGDSRLSTSGGGVTVELAPSIGAELDARASGGGVHSDVPVTVQGTQDEDALVGRINGGGPKMVLRTSGGGIRLRKG